MKKLLLYLLYILLPIGAQAQNTDKTDAKEVGKPADKAQNIAPKSDKKRDTSVYIIISGPDKKDTFKLDGGSIFNALVAIGGDTVILKVDSSKASKTIAIKKIDTLLASPNLTGNAGLSDAKNDLGYSIAVVCIVVALLFLALMQYKEYRNKRSKKTVKMDTIPTPSVLDDFKAEIKVLRENLNASKIENQKLREYTDELSAELKKRDQVPVVTQPLEPKAPRQEVFYLSIPSGELGFNDSYKSTQYESGSQFYKLYTHEGATSGEFEFLSYPDALKYAVGKPHTHLSPCCDWNGGSVDRVTKITTKKRGQVELHNGFWKIVRKATIEFN